MQNRVKRRGLALLVTVGMLAVPIGIPASATPHASHHASNHGHALVDRNHDHLSDGLDAKLAHESPTRRIDVVATFATRGAMRGARRALGRVDTTFSLIPGFVAASPRGRCGPSHTGRASSAWRRTSRSMRSMTPRTATSA